jgi:hypothetical protein
MSQRSARLVSAALLLALLFGTLMPGPWKDAALRPLHSPVDLAMLAHMALFAGLSFTIEPARYWKLRAWHLPILALALALATEILQFLAVQRHPRLLDVGFDLFGAFMGWALFAVLNAWARPPRAVPASSAATSRARASRPSDK